MNGRAEIRFDGWTLHTATGELVRGARRVRLQLQPQQVLEELLDHPGELVTREQLIARLWPRGVVNFDLSLNSAVRRLRVALDDHAETPRHIETVPRRGYRFVGVVEAPPDPVPAATQPVSRDLAPVIAPDVVTPRASVAAPAPRWRAVAALLLMAGVSVGAGTFSQIGASRSTREPGAADQGGVARERVVRAEFFMHRRLSGDLARARQLLSDAVALDPGDAKAWAGLASAYWLETVSGELPADQGLPMVREAAERSLALDPKLAEPHLRLANYRWRSGDHDGARRHLEAAAELDPDDPLGLSMRAALAARDGRLDDAVRLQRRTVEVEPLSLVQRTNLVVWLIMADQLGEAEAELRRMRELQPEAPQVAALLSRVLILEGRHDQALALARTMSEGEERWFAEAAAHHAKGNRESADAALRDLIGASAALYVAELYAYRGDSTEAFAWLRTWSLEHCEAPQELHSPFLRPLRADPRWSALVKSNLDKLAQRIAGEPTRHPGSDSAPAARRSSPRKA